MGTESDVSHGARTRWARLARTGWALRPKAAKCWFVAEKRTKCVRIGNYVDTLVMVRAPPLPNAQMTNKPLGSVALVAPASQLERAVRCDGGD